MDAEGPEGTVEMEVDGVLPHHTLQKTNVYALYPSRKFVDAKTKTWVEFLRAHLPQVIARDQVLLDELTEEQIANEASVLLN